MRTIKLFNHDLSLVAEKQTDTPFPRAIVMNGADQLANGIVASLNGRDSSYGQIFVQTAVSAESAEYYPVSSKQWSDI
jgi:hypothetical protein